MTSSDRPEKEEGKQEIKQFSTVRLVVDLEDGTVPAGSLACVVDVWTSPCLGYGIEVFDEHNKTIFVGAVSPEMIALT